MSGEHTVNRGCAEFVADGYDRAMEGIRESRRKEISARVTASYEAKFTKAGIIGRLWLKFRMNREIRRAIDKGVEDLVARDALY